MKTRIKDGWHLRVVAWDGQQEFPVSDEDFLIALSRTLLAFTLTKGDNITYNL
jgi:hypothetical protein